MNFKESKRQRLLSLINTYLSQSNIKMKYVLRKYQKKLVHGRSLTDHELQTMIPLLVHNLRMSEEQVRTYFAEVTLTEKPQQEQSRTLEEFFVD